MSTKFHAVLFLLVSATYAQATLRKRTTLIMGGRFDITLLNDSLSAEKKT
jgi:hypothetical protein